MTSGLDWAEDYHDPDSRASTADRAMARGRRWHARAAHDDPRRRAARAPLRLLQPRLDGARLGPRTGDRTDGSPRARPSSGRGSAPSTPRSSASTPRPTPAASRSRRLRLARDRPRLGPDRHAPDRRPRGTATRCSTRPGSTPAAVRSSPSSGPAGCRARSRPTPASAITGGRSTTRGDCVTADGMRGQFVYVDRPRRTVVVKTSAWPYDDPWWDRQCRDLCYLALPAIADAPRRLRPEHRRLAIVWHPAARSCHHDAHDTLAGGRRAGRPRSAIGPRPVGRPRPSTARRRGRGGAARRDCGRCSRRSATSTERPPGGSSARSRRTGSSSETRRPTATRSGWR